MVIERRTAAAGSAGAVLHAARGLKKSVNIGSSSARVRSARGHRQRRSKATPDEIAKMELRAGATARSGSARQCSTLGTTPTSEVIALAKAVGGSAVSIRRISDDAAKVLDSVRETIAIGEEGGLPTGHASQDHWTANQSERRYAEADRRGPRPRWMGRSDHTVTATARAPLPRLRPGRSKAARLCSARFKDPVT